MKHFETTDEFLLEFAEYNKDGFSDPVPLKDAKIGFSIKCNYPADIRYKPAKYEDGKPDNVAVIWVVYAPPEHDSTSNISPLYIKISNMSLYRSRHYDYDYKDKECPTKESVENSLASPQPISLEFPNECFYDHDHETFLIDNNNVTGIEVLKHIMKRHCDTVHVVKGLSIRTKLRLRDKSTGILGKIIDILTYVLKIMFGRTLEKDNLSDGVFSKYRKESLKKLSQDSIDLLGYKAARSVIVLFCSLTVILSVLSYKILYPCHI